ncbi:hypothetical protein PSET11_00574 [Arthrobacter ulcerisalmonis]|uniref:Uncharacterized protein n=1 Tax=Arthrobacter ulcerisalmonis TaxID=2483813 RepID=A0A3P5WWG0_9MICC|nr:hypothetical protein [Arthrobacter ulcerisalmonis]VDC20337.1 hypothetical protein PSET11_00574 [Arthrobacter ulcerisalmonis]
MATSLNQSMADSAPLARSLPLGLLRSFAGDAASKGPAMGTLRGPDMALRVGPGETVAAHGSITVLVTLDAKICCMSHPLPVSGLLFW